LIADADAGGALPRFVVERLDPARHDRENFDCGVEPLDRYLKQQASQDMRRQVAAVFVLRDEDTGPIAGYFTLSQSSVRLGTLPEMLAKRLPRQNSVPVTLLGRLAVDRQFQGKGIGRQLLIAAMRRAYAVLSDVAAWSLVVDAKDDRAAAFYRRFGFEPLDDVEQARRLFLPMKTVEDLLKKEGLA